MKQVKLKMQTPSDQPKSKEEKTPILKDQEDKGGVSENNEEVEFPEGEKGKGQLNNGKKLKGGL